MSSQFAPLCCLKMLYFCNITGPIPQTLCFNNVYFVTLIFCLFTEKWRSQRHPYSRPSPRPTTSTLSRTHLRQTEGQTGRKLQILVSNWLPAVMPGMNLRSESGGARQPPLMVAPTGTDSQLWSRWRCRRSKTATWFIRGASFPRRAVRNTCRRRTCWLRWSSGSRFRKGIHTRGQFNYTQPLKITSERTMMKKKILDACCPLVANDIATSEFLSEIEKSNSIFEHIVCCSLYNMCIFLFVQCTDSWVQPPSEDPPLKAQSKHSWNHVQVIAKVSHSHRQQLSPRNLQPAQWLQVRPRSTQPLPHVHRRAHGHEGRDGVAAVRVAAEAAVPSRQPHRTYLHGPQLYRLGFFQGYHGDATFHLRPSISLWSPSICPLLVQAPVPSSPPHSIWKALSQTVGWDGPGGKHKVQLPQPYLCSDHSGKTLVSGSSTQNLPKKEKKAHHILWISAQLGIVVHRLFGDIQLFAWTTTNMNRFTTTCHGWMWELESKL